MAEDDNLYMWCVYDHPKDAPNKVVARLWRIPRGQPGVLVEPIPTDTAILRDTLDEVRTMLARMGLYRLARSEMDDPVIVETWL